MSPTAQPAWPTTKPAPSAPAEMPYRFIGRSVSDGGPAILLFGRGRVVTVRGPGPVDDEYVAEVVLDDYLVIRHLPTSAGHFLPLVHRPSTVAPVQDPEDSPRD